MAARVSGYRSFTMSERGRNGGRWPKAADPAHAAPATKTSTGDQLNGRADACREAIVLMEADHLDFRFHFLCSMPAEARQGHKRYRAEQNRMPDCSRPKVCESLWTRLHRDLRSFASRS